MLPLQQAAATALRKHLLNPPFIAGAASCTSTGFLLRHQSGAYTTSSATRPPLFTETHEVLRAEAVEENTATLTVGLAERSFDLIGDVKRVQLVVKPGESFKVGLRNRL